MSPVQFRVLLGALAGFYLAIELVYVGRLPLAMDEFQFASEIERLRTELPYRDFVPYKNLLGYYLQSVPLALGRSLGIGPWDNLILLKSSIALVVAVTIFWLADRLRAFFDARAILLATSLLVVMSTFLERSAVIRVEMLASLFGAAAALAILRGRSLRAGLLVGIAFLVTQKAAYYVVASGAVFACELLMYRGRREEARMLASFAIGALAPTALYLAVFAWASGWDPVWQAMFVDSSQVALWSDYSDKRWTFWWQTLSRNPAFYLVGGLGLIFLFVRALSGDGERDGRRRLAVYAVVVLGLCVWHRQPWPYFFVMLVPIAWITSIAFFAAMSSGIGMPREWQRLRRGVVLALLALGVAIPMSRLPTVLARDNAYQRANFEVLDRVVGPDETYVAGTNILYHRPFQPAGVRWLDRRRLAEIEAQSPEERREFILDLHRQPIKAFVVNYRTDELPADVHEYLSLRFRPMFGSIFTHSPQCDSNASRIGVRFPGEYVVHATPGTKRVAIQDRTIAPGGLVSLESGFHRVELEGHCQLQFVLADLGASADARFLEERAFFKDVYDY